MPQSYPIHNLEELLERLKESHSDRDQISIDAILDSVGRRSFGPILLAFGLIPASPLSGVPGVPTLTAILVLLVIVQVLTGHDHFWLPRWLLERHISKPRFVRAMDLMQRPAHWIDRVIHPRLQPLTTGPAVYAIAVICGVIALLVPPLELIPFANTISGIALSLFGLALISHDGVLVLIGLASCMAALIIVLGFQGG